MSNENNMVNDDFYALKDIDMYSVLCITKETFTPEIIKKKYRKLSIKYHPDKNREEGANDKFTLIQLAYSILSDEQKKAMYDLVRDSESQIEDHNTMKVQDKIYIPKISDDEFQRRIVQFDKNIDEDYDEHMANKLRNKGKMSDSEANSLMKRDDNLLSAEMKEKFQQDYEKLKSISDMKAEESISSLDKCQKDYEKLKSIASEKAKADAFNAMFDVARDIGDEDEDVQDLMLYNGNTTLMNANIANTENYDSMFSQSRGTYEDAFKINSAYLHEELDDRTIEEQMAEYENQTTNLEELAIKSTLKDGRGDFRFDMT